MKPWARTKLRDKSIIKETEGEVVLFKILREKNVHYVGVSKKSRKLLGMNYDVLT